MSRIKIKDYQPSKLKDSYRIFCNLTKDKSILTKINLNIEQLQLKYNLDKPNIENLYRLIQLYGKIYLHNQGYSKIGRPPKLNKLVV